MRGLVLKAFQSQSLLEGFDFFYQYLKNTFQADYFKVYLLSEDQSFLTPLFLYGNTPNFGPLSIHESSSMIAGVYRKNEDLFVADIDASKYQNNPLIQKQKIKALLAVPFLNQGVISVEFLSPVLLDEQDLMLKIKTFASILLNRFYLETVKQQIRRSVDDIQNQIAFSNKLSYLGQLASALVHEIKNPLTTVNLLIHQLLEDIPQNLMAHNDLMVIKEETERISRLLSDFLNFAKPKKPAFEPVTLSEAVQKTLQLIQPRLKQKNLQTQLSFIDEVPVNADRDQIQQIILNLCLNALEVVEENRGKLVFKGRQQVKKGSKFYNLILEDNGPGIKKEILAMIFEPFFSETGRGTGLGLSIVHRLVENHGGFIEVYNLLHGGACFSIYFPL